MTEEGPRYRIHYIVTGETATDAAKLAYRSLYRWIRLGGAAVIVTSALLFIGGLTVFAVILLFLSVASLLIATDPVQRWFTRREGRSIFGSTLELEIDDDGLHASGITGSGVVPWSGMTEVRQDARTVLFMRDRIPIGYIPSAAFESPAQRAEIVEFALGRVASAQERTMSPVGG
jgi:hypothetical protein